MQIISKFEIKIGPFLFPAPVCFGRFFYLLASLPTREMVALAYQACCVAEKFPLSVFFFFSFFFFDRQLLLVVAERPKPKNIICTQGAQKYGWYGLLLLLLGIRHVPKQLGHY